MKHKKHNITIAKALELINVDKIEHTYSHFMTCHSWRFEYEGVEYELVQHEGIKLTLKPLREPYNIVDHIPLTEDMELFNRHINL